MPLQQLLHLNPHTLLGLWHIREKPAEMEAALAALAPALSVPAFGNQKRQREWLASRLLAYTLLRQFTPTYYHLEADLFGKPVFKDSALRLSLSHSGDLAGVILSEKANVGIDLELIRQKISSLAPKFLSEEEQQQAGQDAGRLCLFWSIKETLYKVHGQKRLIFKEQLRVDAVHGETTGMATARVLTAQGEQPFRVQFTQVEGHVLTYCLEEQAPEQQP